MRVVDSHTEGEPTRVFLDDQAPFAGRTLEDHLRAWRTGDGAFSIPPELLALVSEPRAAPATVGAIVCAAARDDHRAGLIFFNAAGPLGMCGHGTIGAVVTLRHLGRLRPGEHRFATPVGSVTARLVDERTVEVDNVASYRHAKGVEVAVGDRRVRGDVAWGGNWFYLVDGDRRIGPQHLDALRAEALSIHAALRRAGVCGADGATIDHVALYGPPQRRDADSRNFVLCPNGAHDRSPCGTGTSAKLACLAADGRLAPGAVWRQESAIGSRFEAWYRRSDERASDGRIAPTIRGRAWITGDATLVVDPSDPARADGWREE